MKLLVTGSSIRGLPVVTIDGGEDVAEVRDIIYSAQAGRIVGFTLNKRGRLSGRRREVLAIEQIRAIGRDAVMIGAVSDLLGEDQESEAASHDPERDVIGNDVLTESGVSLGHVLDVVVLTGTSGEVVGYQIESAAGGPAYIPLPAQLAVSGDALIVPEGTEQFVRDDLVGLGAAVDDFRARLGIQ